MTRQGHVSITHRTTKTTSYKQILQGELARRCDRNPRYSLRAFAKALGIDPGALSLIFTDKRVPSFKMAKKILGALALPPEEEARFLSSLTATQRSRGLLRISPQFGVLGSKGNGPTTAKSHDLSLDLFRVIADLYHYGILELTFTEGFKSDPAWIASQLDISVTTAKLAIQRLLDLGLLEVSDGKYRKSHGQLTTADKHITDASLKLHQRQVLEKAIHSLENDSIDTRSNTSMTMSIDPELIPAAKVMIEGFTNQLCAFLESGARRQVYELNINLFATQKKQSSVQPSKKGEIK